MDTPSQELSAKIIERLIAEKLLLPTDGKKLMAKLADGNMRPEDWQRPLELAGEKEARR